MPSVTIHMILAHRVLDVWEAGRSDAPFPTRDPVLRSAFCQGAVGPDLGYFPGGFRPFSELAHYLSSADLSRRLAATARTPIQVAFARGWLTHVLADVGIHPMVAEALGERRHGQRGRFVDGFQDPTGHIRVETGLDAFYALRSPGFRPEKLAPAFDRGTVGWLASAFEAVYSLRVDRRLLLRSHRAVARGATRGLVAIRQMAKALGSRSRGFSSISSRVGLRAARLVARALFGRASSARAFLDPVLPEPWLVEGVDGVARAFPALVQEHLDAGLTKLENRNLDTGQREEEARTHGGARRARRLLEELRRAAGSVPAGHGALPASPDPLPVGALE